LYLGHFVCPVAIGHAARRNGRGIGTGASTGTGWCARQTLHASSLGGKELGRSHGSIKYRGPASTCCLWPNNSLLSLRVEMGSRWAGRIGEAPCEQRIMDKLGITGG
jgi:hypothetical protein